MDYCGSCKTIMSLSINSDSPVTYVVRCQPHKEAYRSLNREYVSMNSNF